MLVNTKFFKFLIGFLVLISIYKIYTLNYIENLISVKKIYKFQANDNYCDQYKEWIELGEFIFIKKDSGYFFLDTSKILVSALHHANKQFEPKLIILVKNVNGEVIKEIELIPVIAQIRLLEQYRSTVLIAEFSRYNLKNYESKDEIFVSVRDMKSGLETSELLNVKINLEREKQKKFAMICSKVYYGNKIQVEDFERWFTMSKYAGFDKIVMGNHSLYATDIYKNNQFLDLLERNHGFVEVIQLQCFPNFWIHQKIFKRCTS